MGWAPRDRPDTPARSRSADGAATYSCRRPAPPTPPPRSPAPGAPTGPADPAGRAPRCLHRPSGRVRVTTLVEQHPHPHEPLVDAIALEARVVQHALAVGPQPLSRRDEGGEGAVTSGGRPSAWLLLASPPDPRAAPAGRAAGPHALIALVPILAQGLAHDALKLRGNIRVKSRQWRGLPVEDGHDDVAAALASERASPRDHLVEHHPSDQMSVRWSTSRPRTCSGDM